MENHSSQPGGALGVSMPRRGWGGGGLCERKYEGLYEEQCIHHYQLRHRRRKIFDFSLDRGMHFFVFLIYKLKKNFS